MNEHRYDWPAIDRRAISLDDAIVQKLVNGLSRTRTTTIVGLFERRAMAVYNSAIVVGRGGLLGVYAKTHPVEDGCSPGDAYPVWPCGDHVFGVNICADLNHRDAADRLVQQRASLICCPINMMLRPKKAALWRQTSPRTPSIPRAATGCGMVTADVCGSNEVGWLSYGCTAAVRPDGTVQGHVAESADGAVSVEI